MPSFIGHECFVAPSDANIKIWRYMDFTKFVALLETSSLFLSRSDQFEDPYEGSWSRPNRDRHSLFEKGYPTTFDIDGFSEMALWMRYCAYINCWHMNDREFAAMWKLYAKTDEAVAVQSTYHRLHNCLPNESYLGVVNYIDYDHHIIPFNNAFWPYVHKRLSFEHERELRVVEISFPSNENETLDLNKVDTPKGKLRRVDLNLLIENVYVSPTAPQWFFDLVNTIIQRYNYRFLAKQSDMSRAPVF